MTEGTTGTATDIDETTRQGTGTAVSADPEQFDPVGTLLLIGLYFAILVIMWFVMYFVEFAGNGPTVVG